MSFPKHSTKTRIQALGVLLASSLMLSAANAQIGPIQPQQHKPPAKENSLTKTLGKFLNPKKNAEQEESTEPSTESSTEKEKVTMPAADSPQSAPPSAQMTPVRPPMLSQPPLTQAKIEPPQVDSENPPIMSHPKLDDPNNPLGFTDAVTKLKKYSTLVDAHRYSEAKPGLLQLRQSLVDLTEAHIGLYKTLNQLPSARGQAELEKELALQFAQLRDRAMIETAKVYIAEKDYPKAVKELTEVVKSQPRSKLGLRSYELLQEIGFTEKLQLTQ